MKISNNKPSYSSCDKVILFDGQCKLCNVWIRFVIRHDKNHVFKFTSMQSDKGQAILKHFNMSLEFFDTMLYVENKVAYEKSTAFLRVVRLLPFPANLLSCFMIFSGRFRDRVYDHIARNRYKLFGKYEQCLLPEEMGKDRFL